MPAIQPAILKKQVAALVQHLDVPPVFVRELRMLFEFYSDRAIRPGQATKNRPLTRTYKIRPPVLRQIILELEPLVEKNPEQGLQLCDTLWEQNYLEYRLLAGMLIGKIPTTFSTSILERMETWLQPDLETQLMTALFDNGFEKLKQEEPNAIVKLAKNFLSSKQLFHQQVGLRALKPVLKDADFKNLPVFFRILQPFVLKINSNLRPDLLEIVALLIQRSPQEMAYFLRESLNQPENPDTPWIIRHSLPHFPGPLQTGLREYLRQNETRINNQ